MCEERACASTHVFLTQFLYFLRAGAVQFLCQALYASLCLVWLDLPFEHAGYTSLIIQGFLVVCLFISVPCTMMYFILLGFHVWLMFLGYGTYEWMLRRRKQKSAARKAREAMTKKMSSEVTGDDGAAGGPRSAVDSVASTTSRHLSSVGSGNDFVHVGGEHSSSRTKSVELTSL